MRPAFIAEVCSNHGSDLARALRFVESAAEIGCTGVKFQQFRIARLFAPEALAADPALAARRAWEWPPEHNAAIARRCRSLGLRFGSTPFDYEAVAALEPHVDFFKVSSYQVLWLDFLRAVARAGKPVVLATGMADLAEVRRAVAALASGGCERPMLLHCVSAYPTPPEQANLAAIDTLRRELGLPVGWSDHTARPEVVARAVSRFGAEMVEFHLDLDREGVEYGLGHCWLPEPARALIASDPAALAALAAAGDSSDGHGRVEAAPIEAPERDWRSDPSDGLRPLVHVRRRLRGERNP